MPFTLAHAAAAIPFQRTRLIPSALVIGCFSPDFEYFIRLGPKGIFGHTFPGLFAFDLPVSVLVWWLFHAYAKEPILAWLPADIRQRVPSSSPLSSLRNAREIVLILISIIIGAATHILWDAFTHRSFWPYDHWSFLRRAFRLPVVGPLRSYTILQHLSTLVGLIVLLIWFWHWYRHTAPIRSPKVEQASGSRTAVLALCVAAAVAGFLRGLLGVGVPANLHENTIFLAEVVTTAITVFWLEIVACGVIRAHRRFRQKCPNN